MTTRKLKMPLDNLSHPVPALRVRPGGAKQGVAAAATSTIGPFTPGTQVIEIYAGEAMRYETGDENVEASATSHFLDAGERLVRSLGDGPDTHLAIIRVGTEDVPVEVSELE
ncbi:MAG: hypothetical protein KF895_02745 [Parvibaculum sp.]|nr:hypothetical protein [Parvibaculum sp.]